MLVEDYLFQFSDEDEAKTSLAEWVAQDESGESFFHPFVSGSGVLPVNIIVTEAVFDEYGNLVSPNIYSPGFWVVISLIADDDYGKKLWDEIPQCVQITKRPERPTPVSQTIIKTRLGIEQYSDFTKVDPVFAGASYLWGM